MKFFTVKEAAERWNISPRRVTLLAAQGRIEGAVPPGCGWLIPENAPKPEDRRRKGTKAPSNPEDRYIFPFPQAIVNSQETVDDFTPEERELYRQNLTYEEGNFAEARSIAEQLLHSKNPYIRLGALYQLPTICMYLGDFEAADRYTVVFRTAMAEATEHQLELAVLLDAFNSEICSATEYVRKTNAVDVDSLPRELFPFFAAGKLFCELVTYSLTGVFPELSPYLLICRQSEDEGYYYYAMFMHISLFMFYSSSGASEKEQYHLRAAVEIALEHRVFLTLTYALVFNMDSTERVLRELPSEMWQRIRELATQFTESRNAYARHQGINTALTKLTQDDLRLISCCQKERSLEQMAETFGLSKSGMNRHLGILYKKLGVKSKRELCTVYFQSAMDWKGH